MTIAHWYGNDLMRNARGGLLAAQGVDIATQRILRVLLTAAGDYIWHTGYGIGAGKYVGRGLSPAVLTGIKAKFTAQVVNDPDVGRNPPPKVTFDTSTPNELGVTIQYTYAPTGQVQTLSFAVTNG